MTEEHIELIEQWKELTQKMLDLGIKIQYDSYSREYGYLWVDIDSADDFLFSFEGEEKR